MPAPNFYGDKGVCGITTKTGHVPSLQRHCGTGHAETWRATSLQCRIGSGVMMATGNTMTILDVACRDV
ncbi:MAG: hypothetical protein LBQ70_02535, partial [Prevotellaceae bacterium]|nr:hypothetical protein [Prevotellaceae bacterium]